MNSEIVEAGNKPEPELSEINLIAANVIHWSRRQAEAYNRMPLTYVDCLLDQMAEANYVAWEDIPEEVGRLLPRLKADDCLALVGIYLDRTNTSA